MEFDRINEHHILGKYDSGVHYSEDFQRNDSFNSNSTVFEKEINDCELLESKKFVTDPLTLISYAIGQIEERDKLLYRFSLPLFKKEDFEKSLIEDCYFRNVHERALLKTPVIANDIVEMTLIDALATPLSSIPVPSKKRSLQDIDYKQPISKPLSSIILKWLCLK